MVRPLICDIPWFVSRLSYSDAPRTVLAGTDFANQLVGVFPTEQEAQALVAAHNARLNEKGPASAATDPDHGPTIPEEETAMNRPKDTTAAAKRNHDSVVHLGRRLADARSREEALGDQSSSAKRRNRAAASIYYRATCAHVADEVDALRTLISMERATTIEAAIIQTAELVAVVERLCEAAESAGEGTWREDHRAAQRLLYSILGVLERSSERSLADLVDADFGNAHMNPWTPVDERIAAVETSCGRAA